MLRRFMLDHPASVGETYGEHAKVAASFGIAMIAGGLACLVHAIVPAFFATTGSDMVRRLYQRMSSRGRQPERTRPRATPSPWQLEYEI